MKFYSVKEIAELLQITPRGIQKLIRDGKLSAYKIGREFRVSEDDFQLFLESRKTK